MTFARATFTMFASLLIWAAHFLIIYLTTGIACARASPNDFVPWVIGGVTLLAVLALVMVMRTARAAEPFAAWIGVSLAALAMIAIVWESLPVLIVPICV
ncbi:MAG: hypothetical protein ACREV0_06740 [Burkholderiales bacterium]